MSATRKPNRLHWLKFNPTEWLGMFSDLTDEELGMLHRVIAKLWAVPGNGVSEDDLLTSLRLAPGSHRAAVLHGLIGYALHVSDDGLLYIPALHEAFAEATARTRQAKDAAAERWEEERRKKAAALLAHKPDAEQVDF